ncbi:MAG: ATP-binding protein [Paracoccaceae bacterium]|nr:ATP-binding protein [Paracoccaceae bacterium]
MPHDGAQDASSDSLTFGSIKRTFPSDFRWVRRTIHEIEDILTGEGLASEDVGSVSIVLAEALNNVVEHAYEDGEKGEVTLVIRQRGESLIIEIRDNGKPMPKGRAPVGNHPMTEFNQFDSMPEGGFGWFLIRELVRDLVYDRQDGENVLYFRYRPDGK